MLVAAGGFSAFMSEYSLSLDMAAKVFAVSRRTVTRWRATERISSQAAQIMRAIRWQSAPWSYGFRRSLRAGITTLAYEWRQLLFASPGGRWQDYRTPAEVRAQAQANAAAQARREAHEAARRAERRQAVRKAQETKRERAAARQAALAAVNLPAVVRNSILGLRTAAGALHRAAGRAVPSATPGPGMRAAPG